MRNRSTKACGHHSCPKTLTRNTTSRLGGCPLPGAQTATSPTLNIAAVLVRGQSTPHAHEAGLNSRRMSFATTYGERLRNIATRFIADWKATGDKSYEEIERAFSIYVHDTVVCHADGVIYKQDLHGLGELVQSRVEEGKAYEVLELTPLLAANNESTDTVFVLSKYKVKNVGKWRGQAATGQISEGIQVDELHVDPERNIIECWVRRQLTQEEKHALLQQGVDHAEAVAFDASMIKNWGNDKAEHSLQHLLDNYKKWVQAWNVRSESGDYDMSAIDSALDPGFNLKDAMGIAGKPHETFSAINSRDDAKAAVVDLTRRWAVEEHVINWGGSTGYNMLFVQWSAKLLSKAEGDTRSMRVEALDLALFSDAGQLACVYQFRTPTGYERRHVLAHEPAGAPQTV